MKRSLAMVLILFGLTGACRSSGSDSSETVADDQPVTVERLVDAASRSCGRIKDVVADLKMTMNGVELVGTRKLLFPDYSRLDAQAETMDESGQLKVTSVFHLVKANGTVTVEQNGRVAGNHAGAFKYDVVELPKVAKEMGGALADLPETRPPDFAAYLTDLQGRGWKPRVTKVEKGLATLEAERDVEKPGPMGKYMIHEKEVVVIGVADGFPRSIRDYENGEVTSSEEYSNLKFDAGLKVADFVYVPSPGVPVVDLVEYLKAQIKEMQAVPPPEPGK